MKGPLDAQGKVSKSDNPTKWAEIPVCFDNFIYQEEYGDIKMSLDLTLSSRVTKIMRKIPSFYDYTIKYLVQRTQKVMRMLYNPIYANKRFDFRSKEVSFYEIDSVSRKVKKDYKTGNGNKIMPRMVKVISEGEEMQETTNQIKKRKERQNGVFSGDAQPQKQAKTDIILPSSDTHQIKQTKERKNENKPIPTQEVKKTEPPASKSTFKFEVLKEEANYDDMVFSDKIDQKLNKRILKVKLKDYESIQSLNVDISSEGVKITKNR